MKIVLFIIFILALNIACGLRCSGSPWKLKNPYSQHHTRSSYPPSMVQRIHATDASTKDSTDKKLMFLQNFVNARLIMRSIIGCVSSMSVALLPWSHSSVNAAIPSIDEFYQTSGTKIVDKSAVASKSKLQIYSSADISLSFFDSLESSLKSLSSSIDSQDWDDVLKTISQYKIVMKQYFGLDSLSTLASQLSISRSTAQDLEDLREDLKYDLSQLDEYARSHRIIYFNKEDMKIIKVMTTGDENGDIAISPEDLADASAMLGSARDITNKIRQLIS